MTNAGFLEYQTPILTASSPEGARDFLVPSRLHPGTFYALPQAPQQFKQLLMIAGFDRYFQIAPCFRDEDARADRSPGEFYQLDLEMAFVTQEDVFNTLEPILSGLFQEFSPNKNITSPPFPKIPYRDAMLLYGSDKPDLRNPLIIKDVTPVFKDSSFKVFASLIEKGAVVRAVAVPHGAQNPRSFFDKMNSWAQGLGQPGLGYLYWRDENTVGPIAKNLNPEQIQLLKEHAQISHNDDAVFFICDTPQNISTFAGQVRQKLAEELNLINTDSFQFCWIVDYPMFERDETSGKIDFSHNPFSMPQGGLDALNSKNPTDILAFQYDIVCNGVELSSGAIRNHLPEIMYKAFSIAGYSQNDVDAQFGGMINALKYGAPPHGGSAPGIDRIVMLLAEEQNIREVTAFPMNQNAQDLLMGAPAAVSPEQLKELFLSHLNIPQKDTS
jgi:aspartyl-tRNA synthetase